MKYFGEFQDKRGIYSLHFKKKVFWNIQQVGSRVQNRDSFFEFEAAYRALAMLQIFELILVIAGVAKHQMVALLDHDCLASIHTNGTNHVLRQMIDRIWGIFITLRFELAVSWRILRSFFGFFFRIWFNHVRFRSKRFQFGLCLNRINFLESFLS